MTITLSSVCQSFKRIDDDSIIIKRDNELIVISSDSLVIEEMRKLPQMMEEVTSYQNSANKVSQMFWFKIEDALIVEQRLRFLKY